MDDHTKEGMPNLRGQYNDIDDFIESLAGWDADLAQLVPGQNESNLLSVTIKDFRYTYVSHTLKMLHNVVQVSPGVSFMIPLSNEPVSFLDKLISSPVIFTTPMDQTSSFITPNNYSCVVITVSNQKIQDLLESECSARLPLGTASSLYYPSPKQLTDLQVYLTVIKRRFSTMEVFTSEELLWLKEFTDNEVLPLAISIMTSPDELASSLRPRVFRSALSTILDNLDSPPSITEIAETLGVTTRNIQYLFMKHLGMTPKAFITIARLNVARRRLRYSDFGHGKIAEVANGLGYWHMGNFSKEFKKLFHLSPGDYFLKNNEFTSE